MKKLMAVAAVIMTFSGAVSAASQSATPFAQMNEHEKAAVAHDMMNNGRSGTHQLMSREHHNKTETGMKKNTANAPRFSQMDEHQQAAVAHDMMNNGRTGQHQSISKKHLMQADSSENASARNDIATPFSQLSRSEKAAVSRDMMNNGRSGPHQLIAQKYRSQP